jgi:hypothetical protein
MSSAARTCSHLDCGVPLDGRRTGTRYCSGRCRMAAHRARAQEQRSRPSRGSSTCEPSVTVSDGFAARSDAFWSGLRAIDLRHPRSAGRSADGALVFEPGDIDAIEREASGADGAPA